MCFKLDFGDFGSRSRSRGLGKPFLKVLARSLGFGTVVENRLRAAMTAEFGFA